MDVNQIVAIINSLGFPIFVSCYFIFHCNATLENNTKALNDLREIIKGLGKGD